MVKPNSKKADMQIQQMAFMIVAVFIFFGLVALFFANIQIRKIKNTASSLQTEQAISSLQVIADMPEFSYSRTETMTLDEDKLQIMSGNFSKQYVDFWPVASIEVYKIYPSFSEIIKCPAANCNYYKIYDNNQTNKKTYATFVSICSKQRESNSFFDRCTIGKLVVGVKINEK